MDCYFSRRYPDDPYDRIWEGSTSSSWANLSTQETIQGGNDFEVPTLVLRTAVFPVNNGTVLNAGEWKTYKRSFAFKIFLHFADIQNSQVRLFDISTSDWASQNYSPPYMSVETLYSADWYKSTDGNYSITLVATNETTLPPMLNAYELYNHIPHGTPRTFSNDCEMSPTLPHSFIYLHCNKQLMLVYSFSKHITSLKHVVNFFKL
jgi:hypothetical protein